ncbi:hypothetical protein CPB83DRAFT_859759 [Crepidotus variabilis]|uniref:Secreted protein n=1 Tax=Crepidotus variabilis TaxID=179855 RepID=A0A9P6E9J2_9AGAR|nr:hypothetical protein CPB83DRAFT_859759 [Crepidotus variabilis]
MWALLGCSPTLHLHGCRCVHLALTYTPLPSWCLAVVIKPLELLMNICKIAGRRLKDQHLATCSFGFPVISPSNPS